MVQLAQVLKYKNDEVVYRFAEDFKVSVEESQMVFAETLKWLWLCAYQVKQAEAGRSEVVNVPLLGEFFVIDLMWHTFILFTQDYAEFCHTHFSEFIHHIPQTKAEKDLWAKKSEEDPEGTRKEREAIVYKAYEVIYDVLGEETLCKWTEDFPELFATLAPKD